MGKLSQLERALQTLRIRRDALDQVIRELEAQTATTSYCVTRYDDTVQTRKPAARVRKPKAEPVTP